MAEGHLLHRAARDMTALLVGAPVRVTSPQGRFAAGAAEVDGRSLDAAEAWGKHLLLAFDAGRVVHLHLGLAGTIARVSSPDAPPRPQARARFAGDRAAFDVYAPATCEVGDRALRDRVVARLGPDPLRPDADPERVWAGLRGRADPVGAALLDQALVSGVGNVFRAEALHLVGVHPARPSRDLTRAEFEALWATLARVMRQAVEDGRIATRPGGRRPSEARWVYKQGRCGRCGGGVEEAVIGGRTSYACPRCQPRRQAAPLVRS
ncbi:MAG: Fpg/Nei family DNA glycosylase [Planctomycetes bacterium]|nr:Fpg/Nei family DNA glycosylase [Planctomycetota bacterium]